MTTFIPKVDGLERKWFVIDAKGQVLGKLATRAAVLLTGKHKPIYTPFLDTGDHVIVINAGQVHLSGRKETDKLYRQPFRVRRRPEDARPRATCARSIPPA